MRAGIAPAVIGRRRVEAERTRGRFHSHHVPDLSLGEPGSQRGDFGVNIE